MQNDWTPLQAILNDGPNVTLDDQSVWQVPIKEFKMDIKIVRPVEVKLQLLPQEDGLLVRGHITGALVMPCTLCTEDATVELDHNFDTFEPFPAELEEEELPDPDVDEYFFRLSPQGTGLEVNLGALAWEEFVEALPQYPLCKEGCAGLCPECGQNLNQNCCGCSSEAYDPRLKKLRGLKINK